MNSCGGVSPRESISRTFVPDRNRCDSCGVGAGLAGCHALALVAPERVLEEQRLDPELADVDVVEDPLRVVGAVVVAHAGVVATDDEVGAAVVAADDRVQHRLPRARVVHLGRVDAQDHPLGVVVAVHQDLVAAHPHVRGDVARLGLADQGVQEEPVGDLQRGLGQVLVGAVDRVPGLEGDDPLPAPVGERLLRLLGRQVAAHEGVLVVRAGRRPRSGPRRSASPRGGSRRRRGARRRLSGRRAPPPCRRRARRSPRPSSVRARLPFGALSSTTSPTDASRSVARVIGIDQMSPLAEPHRLADRAPVVGAQKAVERREAAVCEQLEVGGLARAQRQRQVRRRLAAPRRYPFIPHSVRSVPAQRPARESSPSPGFEVQGMHPIDG